MDDDIETILTLIELHLNINGGDAFRIPNDIIARLVRFHNARIDLPMELTQFTVDRDLEMRQYFQNTDFEVAKAAYRGFAAQPLAALRHPAHLVTISRERERFAGFPHIDAQGRINRAHWPAAVGWLHRPTNEIGDPDDGGELDE